MVSYDVNKNAVRHCKKLIDNGDYVLESTWSEVEPSAQQENTLVDDAGWDTYANWHLAVDPAASEETKKRFAFCYGDFRKVHRSALAAAAVRAGQYHHDEIEKTAHELLEHLKSAAGE